MMGLALAYLISIQNPFNALIMIVPTKLSLISLVASLFLVLQCGSESYGQQRRIFIAPDDHTDYFWTADDVTYRAVFLETIDYYLDQISRTEERHPDFHARWNCDGSLWLWEYENHRTPEEFNRLIDRIKDGHISSPLNALACTFGAQPAEAVVRGMYYPGILERKYDLRFPMAVAMENQTLPLGLGSLWAGSGAKYSWRGICNCATKMDQSKFKDRDHEIYWWKGLDGSQILMKWYSFGLNNESIGGYAEARKPNEAIDWVINNNRFRKKHPWKTVGIFGQGWDDLKTLSNEFPKVAMERSNDDLRVVVSNEEDFFKEFEDKYGDKIESESLAYGNEWDLYCMSMAKSTSRVRRAVEQLRTVEALAVLAAADEPEIWKRFEKERQQFYMDVGLYWEHDWTADANEEMRSLRGAWQEKLANRITTYAGHLYGHMAGAIGKKLCFDNDRSILVFNPLGWSRKVTLKELVDHDSDIICRHSGETIPTSFSRVGNFGFERFEIEIPALGYRCLKIVKREQEVATNPKPIKPASNVDGEKRFVLENEHIKVSIDSTGNIRELVDKKNGVNRCGKGGINVLVDVASGPASKDAHAKVYLAEADDHQQRILVKKSLPVVHTIEYLLHADSDSLEIANRISSNFSSTLKWEFDFVVDSPTTWHEEVGAILNARTTSDGGNYVIKNARYDWLSLGHFAAVTGNNGVVELANRDCAFFQLGDSSPSFLDSTSSKIAVLAGGQVDGPKLGIRKQFGHSKFLHRFAIRVGQQQFHPANTMRWSLEWQNPCVAIPQTSNKSETEPLSPRGSLLEIDGDEDILLWAFKPAEEGLEHGTIARFWNLGGEGDLTLSTPGLTSAKSTTHIETDIEPIGVVDGKTTAIKFRAQQMRTVRLKAN